MYSLTHVFIASICLTSPAQQADDDKAELKQLLSRAVKEQLQQQLVAHVGIEIEDMAGVLKLDPAKVKRLRLAAKGATGRFADRNVEPIVRFIRKHVNETETDVTVNGLHIAGTKKGNADSSPQGVPRHRVTMTVHPDRIRPNVRSGNSSYGTSVRGGLAAFRSQGLWTKAVEKVLSKDERETYQLAIAKRRRERCVRLVTEALSIDLRLSEKASMGLQQWLDKRVTKIDDSYLVYGSDSAISRILDRLDLEGLDDILTPDQLVVLESMME